jgi:transcriptional regulator with XRE-family HTH domain
VSSKIISRNIKKLRKKTGLSQDQMARKANMPLSTYLKVENGVTPNPSIQTLLNIAEALEISLDELVGRKPTIPGSHKS